jgi:hypothetical protein
VYTKLRHRNSLREQPCSAQAPAISAGLSDKPLRASRYLASPDLSAALLRITEAGTMTTAPARTSLATVTLFALRAETTVDLTAS